MRRLRNDLPYTFRPPRLNLWLRPLILLMNRHKLLRKDHRIAEVEGKGFDRIAELHEQGHSVLLAPNHSDHSDPHVIMELCAEQDMHPRFMGAREIFEVSPINCWALQASGVFPQFDA